TTVNRLSKSSRQISNVIVCDINHPFHPHLLSCISSGRTRRRYIRIEAHKEKYKCFTILCLAHVL
ncbi:hypothetical protein EWB00_008005, partial [Schistosoma japonicum]